MARLPDLGARFPVVTVNDKVLISMVCEMDVGQTGKHITANAPILK